MPGPHPPLATSHVLPFKAQTAASGNIFYSLFPSFGDPYPGSGAFFGIPDPTLISDSLTFFLV